jgi:hypothetical protein
MNLNGTPKESLPQRDFDWGCQNLGKGVVAESHNVQNVEGR